MEKVKWGIIGCGDVTEVKSGPAFSLVQNSELVAVMRRDANKAEDYAKRHKVPKWYSNADDLINDPEVNAIYIATPPNTHAQLTLKALKAEKPVYVEKPMALNYTEAMSMVKAAEDHKIPLLVAYYRRALPGFVKVKALLDSGAIGAVRLVNIKLYKFFSKQDNDASWRVDPNISGGGHFVDLASHQLDLLDYYFGAISQVKAFAKNQAGDYQAEDIVSAGFLLPNNIIANGTWCFTVSEDEEIDSFEIIGEKGKIEFSCFDFVPIELTIFGGMQSFEYEKPKHVQQDLIQCVVAELLGGKKSPSNGNSGARTNWVLDEVLKEYYLKS